MLEKSVRCETVAFVRWIHLHGVARPQAARRVGLSVSTVGHWEENWKAVHLESEALKALFRQHGVPLVIKSDNGSAFIAMKIEDFLEQQEVYHLLSPPRIPSYNGACEAGIGSLKTRAHHESARHDRPGEWTCDDVEAARLRSNETSRPGGFHAPTPNELWNLRLLISADERQQFRERVEAFHEEVRVERGCAIGADLSRSMPASMNRRAISRALVAQGILEFRWRQITLPILRQKSATIS